VLTQSVLSPSKLWLMFAACALKTLGNFNCALHCAARYELDQVKKEFNALVKQIGDLRKVRRSDTGSNSSSSGSGTCKMRRGGSSQCCHACISAVSATAGSRCMQHGL
jgi:hypothetical protein